jgi:formiminotetrahydrofolate cyclodeaminase
VATAKDASRLAEAVRRACVEAARAGYAEAAIGGLCHEGAFEAAVGSIRRVDLAGLAETISEETPPPGGEAPSAGGAAAITSALAAALVERSASLSARDGPDSFRKRARAIASRAATLRALLLAAAPRGARPVEASDAAVEFTARGAQVATLAAELLRDGPATARRDAAAALRLASSAAECALALAEDDLRGAPDADPTGSAQRRLWRARLLLQRARPALGDAGSSTA